MKKTILFLLIIITITSFVSSANYLFESNDLDDLLTSDNVEYTYVETNSNLDKDLDDLIKSFDKIIEDYESDETSCESANNESKCIKIERENTAEKIIDWFDGNDDDNLVPFLKNIFETQIDLLKDSLLSKRNYVKGLETSDFFESNSKWDDIMDDLSDIKSDLDPQNKSDFVQFKNDITDKVSNQLKKYIFEDLKFDYWVMQNKIHIEESRQKLKFFEELEKTYDDIEIDIKTLGIKNSKIDDFTDKLKVFKDNNEDLENLFEDYESANDNFIDEVDDSRDKFDLDDTIYPKIDRNLEIENDYNDWTDKKDLFKKKYKDQIEIMGKLREEVSDLLSNI